MTRWQEHAACAGQDTQLFYENTPATNTAARRICRRCPVQDDCLQDAVDTGDTYGIRGGYTQDERRRLHRVAPA